MIPDRIEQLLRSFQGGANIARTFGMELSFDEAGQAIVTLPYNPGLDHALGGVHGGVYATLLDTAGWFTAAAVHDCSCWLATAEMSIHFLEAAERTGLRATGRLIKTGKRQDVAEMFLHDEQGRLLAHATGTFIVLPGVPLKDGQ
jgi:uncharacterized protein (TIGR00369 family)